jgi:hypothetical protein
MSVSRGSIFNEKYGKNGDLLEVNYGSIESHLENGEYHIPAFISTASNTKYDPNSEPKIIEMVQPFDIGRRKVAVSVDDFFIDQTATSNLHKALRSGRQRKKNAARSKGGEFQAKRKKRRLYFCSISSGIDVEKLADKFSTPQIGLKGKMYDEVLHLYMESVNELNIPLEELYRNNSVDPDIAYETQYETDGGGTDVNEMYTADANDLLYTG